MYSPRLASMSLYVEHSISQHSQVKKLSYPTLPYYLKSKVNVFLIIFCLLHTSPPL